MAPVCQTITAIVAHADRPGLCALLQADVLLSQNNAIHTAEEQRRVSVVPEETHREFDPKPISP